MTTHRLSTEALCLIARIERATGGLVTVRPDAFRGWCATLTAPTGRNLQPVRISACRSPEHALEQLERYGKVPA